MHFLFHFHHILYSRNIRKLHKAQNFSFLFVRKILARVLSLRLLNFSLQLSKEQKYFMCNGLSGVIIFTKGFTCTEIFHKHRKIKKNPQQRNEEGSKRTESMEKYSWIFNELSERGKSFSEIANFEHYAVLLSIEKKVGLFMKKGLEQVGNCSGVRKWWGY